MNLVIMFVSLLLAIVVARPIKEKSQRTIRYGALALLVILSLAAPALDGITGDSIVILFNTLVALILAQGWNFIGGYTGYAAFGNVAYFGLGAYLAGTLMSKDTGHPALSAFIAFPIAIVVTALIAGLLGLVVLRFKGHYFAIATLAVAVAMPEIINWSIFGNFFGGSEGLDFPIPDDGNIFGLTITSNNLIYYATAILAAVCIGLTAWLSRNKFGYSLVAIRENEGAAEVMGINTIVYKVGAYMLSAALAALAGALLGYQLTSLNTEPTGSFFNTATNLEMIIICLLGGVGTVWGPFMGAMLLHGIEEILRTLSSSQGSGFTDWQQVVFSIIIILVVLFLPRGVMQFVRTRTRLTMRIFLRNVRENSV